MRLITDDEMIRLFKYLDRADAEALEHPFVTFAIRLQFAFAARMSEIVGLEWKWIDFANRRVVWPDSKTGKISKAMSKDAFMLLTNAPHFGVSPYVIPAISRSDRPMSKYVYSEHWRRVPNGPMSRM
jgi:integrase